MSDNTLEGASVAEQAPAPAPNPAVAAATQALAIKDLTDSVAGAKRSIRKLWITVAVLSVITLLVGALTILPTVLFSLSGGPNFRGDRIMGVPGGAPAGTFEGGAIQVAPPTQP